MKRFAYAFFCVVFAACGGGGGASVSIVGDPPEEQAATLADARCNQEVECGEINIDCGAESCVGTIEDVDYDVCYADAEADFLANIEGCDLTAEEEQAAEDCANALLALPCITQAELDAYVAEINAGNEPEPLFELPAVCESVEVLFEGCTPA